MIGLPNMWRAGEQAVTITALAIGGPARPDFGKPLRPLGPQVTGLLVPMN
jgi:hypothetical protein